MNSLPTPRPSSLVPANEDPLTTLDFSANALRFISDALFAWNSEWSEVDAKSRLGLAAILDACRNDLEAVAAIMDRERAAELEARRPE